MKKRVFLASGVAGLALVACAAVFGEASPKLKAFGDALANSASFSATYTVQPLQGAQAEYKVAFAKPNLARVETPTELTVADGQTITTYSKADNTFTKRQQTEAEFNGLFSDTVLTIWKPFFKPDAVAKYAMSKDAGTKTVSGRQLNVVDVRVDPKGDLTLKLFTDGDNSLRQGVITQAVAGRDAQTSVLLVSDSSMSADAGLFAFKAPEGAKEISLAEVSTGVWMNDFSKALNLAKASGKLLMVDFWATWCGPCKMMDAEVFHSERFKKESKDFVLCKVDVDAQQSLAQQYGITAMPTVKFIRGDGSVAHEFVGYGSPDQVFGEMQTARSKR